MGTEDRGRVLLVEADRKLREAHARALTRAGYQLQSTAAPREAVTLATQGTFDVVICDQDLPGIDGMSLVRRLQEKEVGASYVLLCVSRSNDLAVQAAEAGVLQILDKPLDSTLLARAVAAGVAQRHKIFSLLKTIMRPSVSPRSVSATEAKNKFGALLDVALQDGAVVITKHEAPEAILVSADRVTAYLSKHEPDLAALTHEFDALIARMRTPSARAAARGLFSATPKEFGDAAVSAAQRRD